ncbi:MAG: TIR domain-containing protein [Cytophagia bacterium]|nr:MAG: TIR domain-containing protein [Runella sp.]TAG22529.1 MAG: TIR domain-containing protein [Cytophagales bacterium]TAG41564.1 MAG: TIR domain-containing protein [Cytophagia bacterium]TAG83381.1 MAG: TIR domain-containing protein [Cytophagales bacterium]
MASTILQEANTIQKSASGQSKTFDIFLSHSAKDKELVVGTKLILEDLGYSVYVDWIEDPQMDRSSVTKETAELLQKRMQNSKSLFYAFSTNSANSKWMPWECGYFDGIKNGKVAVLPISRSNDTNFKGTEYLGLYYYITIENDTELKQRIWVRESENNYVVYEGWMSGSKPYKR